MYIIYSNKPKNIFIGAIDSISEISNKKQKQVETMNLTMKLGVNINSQNSEIAKVAEYTNRAKLTLSSQMDLENEKEIVKLGIDYDNENILNAKISYKNQEDYIYAKTEQLFDKAFSSKIDEDTKEQFKTIFNELKTSNKEKMKNLQKAIDIAKSSLYEKLENKYFSKTNEKVEIDEKTVKTKKSTLTLTNTQLKEILSDVATDLQENEKFLECFKEESREEIKEELNDFKESISKKDSNTTEATIEFNLYTKGITNKFVKFEIVVKQKEEYTISISKVDSESYELIMNEKNEKDSESKEVFKAIVTIEDIDDKSKEITLEMDIEDIGKVKVNLQTSCVINEPIEEFDTTNSVNIKNLTVVEQQEIMNNLQNMKIYTLLQELM